MNYTDHDLKIAREIVEKILQSGLSIYDLNDGSTLIPMASLEALLDTELRGFSLAGLPIRTRSKIFKSEVCRILGYPIPKSFRKTQPRFISQNFDTYVQKSNNLQIWNEDINPERRYVIVKLNDKDQIIKVRVINGFLLSKLDTTGTLTTKYQARLPDYDRSTLLSEVDTPLVIEWGEMNFDELTGDPSQDPIFGQIIPIGQIYELLLPIVGSIIDKKGTVQERSRGVELQKKVCEAIGYKTYEDNGQYPDIRNQLIEIKLQTSPTIDLGLHSPSGQDVVVQMGDTKFKDCDIRYVIFSGSLTEDGILLEHLYLINGADFEKHIPLFGGKIKNSKIQLPLPNDFFD